MSGLDDASTSGNTYDSSWGVDNDTGNMPWYMGLITMTVICIVVYLLIIACTKVEEHLDDEAYQSLDAKDEKRYTYTMFALGGAIMASSLYAAIFPTQYVSYFVWTQSSFSCLLAAWFFNSVGQISEALQLFFAVNFCLKQAYDDYTAHRPGDTSFPQTARTLTGLHVLLYVVGAVFALIGLVCQDWLWFIVMCICRLVGCLFALPATFKLFHTAKMLRERADDTALVACNSWSAEPMALLYSLFMVATIIWNGVIEIPDSMKHLDYQKSAEVPTLEFLVGFNEALHQRSYSRSSSVWTPMCCASYFVALGVSCGLGVLMSAAPRLGKHRLTGLNSLLPTQDFDGNSSMIGPSDGRRQCTDCTLL